MSWVTPSNTISPHFWFCQPRFYHKMAILHMRSNMWIVTCCELEKLTGCLFFRLENGNSTPYSSRSLNILWVKINLCPFERIKDRICKFCAAKAVEDKNHFLFLCVRYNMIRIRFPVFTRTHLTEIFIKNDESSLKLLSNFVYELFEKRKLMAQDQSFMI